MIPPCTVDQNVTGPKCFFYPVTCLLQAFPAEYVSLYRHGFAAICTYVFRNCFCCFFFQVKDCNPCPALCKGGSERAAQHSSTPGHHCNPAFEVYFEWNFHLYDHSLNNYS